MFTVQGYIDGVAYAVTVGADNPDADPGTVLSGTRDAISLLRLHEDRQVKVTPTGPEVTVTLNEEAAVLGALHALTEVSRVQPVADGQVPEVIPPVIPDVVY